MLYWLSAFSDTIGPLNVFRYITVRTGGALSTALVFVFLFGHSIIDQLRLKQGKGQPIRTDGPQSHLVTKKGTPTMGGLMILSGIIVATVLWANPMNRYVWIVLGVTLCFGAVGFYDDYLKVTRQTHTGFSGRTRLRIETLIAVIACLLILGPDEIWQSWQRAHAPWSFTLEGIWQSITSFRAPPSAILAFPFIKELILPLGWLFVVFGAFIIVGAGNAVNLTDGLDGLAIGPVMIAAGCFAAFSYVVGNVNFITF